MVKHFEVAREDLRCICDPKQFSFRTTASVTPLTGVIGQERAVQAIDFGLNMKSSGYNIFVTGVEGTGKTSIVREIVTTHARKQARPSDWCTVNNFDDQFCPKAISVPSGKAGVFRKQMAKLINEIQTELPKAFGAKSYQERVSKVQEKYNERQGQVFQKLDQSAAKKKLGVNRSQTGFQTFPVIDGKPMTPEQFQALSEAKQAAIKKTVAKLQMEIDKTLRESGRIHQEMQAEIEQLAKDVANFVVKGRVTALKAKYKKCADIEQYLGSVMEDIVDNVEKFLPSEKKQDAMPLPFQQPKPGFDAYQVNVLVDRKGLAGAPVIFEANPTYQNVFGHIEKRAYMGMLTTDYTMVQAGSMLRADGGYLILEIESVLMNPYVWQALKRTLQTKMLQIEDIAGNLGLGTSSLRPEAIPVDVKVILIGGYRLFHLLQNSDSKFNKIFKIRADFDYEVKRTDDTIQQYAQFVARICKDEHLLPFTARGMATVVEFGEKQVADKHKLSLRFGSIHGLIKEAEYWARKMGARSVSDKHVVKAFKEHRFRYNLYEEKTHESYIDNTMMIDVKGKVRGQVNALAVYQIGELSFGRPSRITAETFMGKSGVINIEREAKLSGKTHDKGMMILSGFLGRTFAQKYPLNLSISVTFEQNYGGVDGDSASSTELYAILSSLSGLPIDQGIAVTGSVNQKGQIQAIGGVNQKVEGFYEVCKTKGLTGKQGVMIPKANTKNLMLGHELLRTVKKGRFHIYEVETIEQGIEILTGVPAGKADKAGNFPEDSVFGKARQQLRTYLERAQRLNKAFDDEKENSR